MEHINASVAKLDQFRSGEMGACSRAVDIAANSSERPDGTQGIEDCGIAHVASMEDVIHSEQSCDGFGTQKAVCVGDDADEHDLQSDAHAGSGVEVIAQRVANEVEGEDAEHDGNGGEYYQVRRVEQMGAGIIQHGAPA